MIEIKRRSGRLGKGFPREWLLSRCCRLLHFHWLVLLQKSDVILSVQVTIVERRGYISSGDILQLWLKSCEDDI
jgi:hypothetical protein